MTQNNVYLVVDDDRTFCRALASALRNRGCEVVVAHDTKEALAEAAVWKPRRAVIDLRLPGGGGLTLLAELRAQQPELEAVVLTGYGSIATAVEAVKLGAVHYLTKPASIEEVLRAFEPGATESAEEPAPTLDHIEWEHLQRVLLECGGSISEAARRLGLHRRSLQRKLARGRPT